jgi:DNA-binding transcriptional MerR regulator
VCSRSYLSIGDVLTLLREEFPDVTISKIRFLESQGLVNPERSPSGYRKFFEHDVERLRWVLRQQREHFLPLKVIRDRLAAGELDDPPADAAEAHRNGRVAQPTPVGVAAGNGRTSSGRTEEQMAKADDEAMARILADASRRAAQIPEVVPAERPPLRVVPEAAPPAPVAVAHAAKTGPRSTPATAAKVPEAPAAAVPARTPGRAAAGGATTPPAAPTPAKAERPSAPAAAAKGAPPTPPARTTTTVVTGASMTAEELCAASGLSEIELAGLQGFGLITATEVAGILTFDEDALTVANLAAEFRVFGIEPRHLRLYKNAVDRELGLIEQVIIPLLRQRNPESRQRAVEGAEQMGALGQTMRATLLHAALRRHIGG